MSQFEVVRDIGESLKELLKESFKAAGFTTVTVSNDRPKKDNIKSLPTVNLFLYHLAYAPGYKERTDSLVTTYDKEGRLVEYYQDAPVYLHAQFIVSVFGNTPNEENLLLGLIVKTFLENPILFGSQLKGDSFFPDDKVNVFPNLQADFNESVSFWRSLNEEVRPSLFYYVKFRVESDRRSSELRRVLGRDLAVHGTREAP
ncbi:MAG TPA: Pvc16 family protein [Myxococcota bacterium]|nr:Pvc16 family protein [Myxococcota bacterium]HQK50112.1 Pvc16 family protein [Myxococcota bacterium]